MSEDEAVQSLMRLREAIFGEEPTLSSSRKSSTKPEPITLKGDLNR